MDVVVNPLDDYLCMQQNILGTLESIAKFNHQIAKFNYCPIDIQQKEKMMLFYNQE